MRGWANLERPIGIRVSVAWGRLWDDFCARCDTLGEQTVIMRAILADLLSLPVAASDERFKRGMRLLKDNDGNPPPVDDLGSSPASADPDLVRGVAEEEARARADSGRSHPAKPARRRQGVA